jgi:hypothetical protein
MTVVGARLLCPCYFSGFGGCPDRPDDACSAATRNGIATDGAKR